MTLAAVRAKAVILLFIVAPNGCMGFCVGSLYCCSVIGVNSSLAIILPRNRELVALL